MKNIYFKIFILLIILIFITLGFFCLKVYFSIEENGNYSGEFLKKDLFNSFIYAIGPFLISIIGFRKKLFNNEK